MPISREMRRLEATWQTGTRWPKRLSWIEVSGLRGWEGQRFDLRFPIMALVGENGAGKSTLLQAAATVYAPDQSGQRERFASDFFPDTAWDKIRNAQIRFEVREAGSPYTSSVRKPTDRWRGNPARRKRSVQYIDLSRIQPVPARMGYSKLANGAHQEASATPFEQGRLARFSEILGRTYDFAKMALTDADANRRVPVITQHGTMYSGFHQGAGETTIAELIQADIPKYSLVLIDEIESSLHPRAQRRLMRDLAERCRELELQIVVTTHSPYILDELPLEARAYIMQTSAGRRQIVYGVSPEFAMTQMDDVPYHECDLYVEDDRAAALLQEILAAHAPDVVSRCQIVPYGAASVGQALGIMASQGRFPRPTCVFLDGDNAGAPGCILLPGEDAPEQVVFDGLRERAWRGLDERMGRPYPAVVDAFESAMTLSNPHDWVVQAASRLVIGGDNLWQAMCSEWATNSLPKVEAQRITQAVIDILSGAPAAEVALVGGTPVEIVEPSEPTPPAPEPVTGSLFEMINDPSAQ